MDKKLTSAPLLTFYLLVVAVLVAAVFWLMNLVKQNDYLKGKEGKSYYEGVDVGDKDSDVAKSARYDAERKQSFEGAVVALLLSLLVFSVHAHVVMG